MIWRKDQISKEQVLDLLKKINFTPLEEYKNQATPFKVKCDICKDEIKTRYVNIKDGGKPRCSCKKYEVYEKKEINELLLQRSLKPLEEYAGNTNKPWRMVCLNCNNEISPTLKNIKFGQGCKYCRKGTKKYDETIGRVYLFHHKDAKVLKVGITNQGGTRLTRYSKDWELIKYVELKTGKLAYKLESEIIKIWRVELKLKIALSSDTKLLQKVAGGYTETASEIGLPDAIKRIDEWINRGDAKDLIIKNN